jgi:hypothetical protein
MLVLRPQYGETRRSDAGKGVGNPAGAGWSKMVATAGEGTGPPMTEETLRQLLARVHERLSSASTIDAETREMLTTVMRDIDGALGKGAPGMGAGSAGRSGPGAADAGKAGGRGVQAGASGVQPAAVPSVSSPPVSPDARVAAAQPRLEALAVRFEAEHPSIAQLLRQIGDLLAKAGI